MIICTKCGFENEDSDTFCGSCAAFLEWAGEKQAVEEPAPEPEPEPEPEPAVEAGLFERVKERIVGVGESRTGSSGGGVAEEPTAVAVAEPEAEPEPAVVTPGPVSAPLPSSAPAASAPAVSAAPAATSSAGGTATTSAPAVTTPAAEDTSVVAPAARVAEPVEKTPIISTPPPVVERPASAPHSASPAASSPSAGAGTSTPPTIQAPAASSAPVSSAPATTGPSAGSSAAPAAPPAEPAAPTGPVAPGAVQPEAVKPTAARARPAPKPKPSPQRVINPGDLICGQCGDGNDPVRKFCRRCGASLQQAVVFVPPWYKRLWLRLRKRKVRAAGERPRMRRRAFGGAGGGWISSWVTKIVALAIVVFLILTFVGPFSKTIKHRFSTWYHDVKNAIHTTYNPVHPVGATATSAAPGHPAGNAIDNASNTTWETASPNSGVGSTLTITLQAATNIDKFGVINGDNDTPNAYLSEPRPKVILVTFNGGTAPYSKSITLEDTASFQSFGVSAKKVTSLTVTIESVYASSQGQNAALTEVELFSKS
ncbi:MAG TPA: hypothetical protein VNF71_14630 [Acidimicrobiales bacterium]|nr:hypothetical protein [Acidimicrobiales bacterium]